MFTEKRNASKKMLDSTVCYSCVLGLKEVGRGNIKSEPVGVQTGKDV